MNLKVSSILLCTFRSTVNDAGRELKIMAEELLSSHFYEVIAVVGHYKYSVEKEFKGLPVKVIFNKFYERGVHSSLKAGIMNLDLDNDFFAVCKPNHSHLKKKDYNQLIAATKLASEALIICPSYKGKRGNPALFSSILIPEILDHKDTERGYAYLFERYRDKIFYVEMDNDTFLIDSESPSFERDF